MKGQMSFRAIENTIFKPFVEGICRTQIEIKGIKDENLLSFTFEQFLKLIILRIMYLFTMLIKF